MCSRKICLKVASFHLLKVLCEVEWSALWDRIVSKPCSFYVTVLTAFILVRRQALLQCCNVEQAKLVLLTGSLVTAKDIVKKALFLHPHLSPSLKSKLDPFTAIPKGDLPSISSLEKKKSAIVQSQFYFDLFPHLKKTKVENEPQPSTSKIAPSDLLLSREQLQLQSDECLRRINQIRKKQSVRFDV